MRLIFELYTTKYLGKKSVAKYCLEKLKNLHTKYYPTKAKDHSYKPIRFSFDSPEEFINIFSKEIVNEGYASLYKIKRIFEFFVFWRKGDISFFKQYPGMKFNTISIVVENGSECIEDNKAFKILYDIWIDMCSAFDANYGYCYLDDSVDMRNTAGGQGLCLPRVFWKSYFNKDYVNSFAIDCNTHIDNCKINSLENGGVILTINDKPEKLTVQTELEKSIIKSLGEEYFWSFSDNWASPKKNYKMPELDLSEILAK